MGGGESSQSPRNGKPCHMHPLLISDGAILPRGHQGIVGVRVKNNVNCALKVFEINLKLLYITISFLLLGIHKFTILMLERYFNGDLKICLYAFVFIKKQYPENFAFLIP